MPSEAIGSAGGEQRLHPASLLFGIGSAARSLLLPGLIALLAFGRRSPELWLLVMFFPAVASTVLRYWSYRYRCLEDELVIQEGIITRNERHIPYAKIQNIDLAQNPLHRLFGVAVVRLETASGGRPEATMRVLSLEAVRQMRERVVYGKAEASAEPRPDDAPCASPARVLLHLPFVELVRYGLISNRGMVVVAAAFGAAWQLDLFERLGLTLSPDLLRDLPLPGAGAFPIGAVLLGSAGLVAGLVGLRLFSIALALLTLHRFQLTRRADDLRAQHGLITRISKTIPRHRIQRLSVRESPLHRWFRRVELAVETAGGTEGDESSDRIALAPLIERDRLPELLREILPDVELERASWRPVAPRAFRRLFVRSLAWVLLFSAGVGIAAGPWALAPAALLLPLPWIAARLYVRHTAWATVPGAVLHRSGWWTRRLVIARFSKIQVVELSETPFDRRHGMASLHVDTAGGGRIGNPIAIAFLESAVAATLLRRLEREAGATAFRW